jgi:hypothetical protein
VEKLLVCMLTHCSRKPPPQLAWLQESRSTEYRHLPNTPATAPLSNIAGPPRGSRLEARCTDTGTIGPKRDVGIGIGPVNGLAADTRGCQAAMLPCAGTMSVLEGRCNEAEMMERGRCHSVCTVRRGQRQRQTTLPEPVSAASQLRFGSGLTAGHCSVLLCPSRLSRSSDCAVLCFAVMMCCPVLSCPVRKLLALSKGPLARFGPCARPPGYANGSRSRPQNQISVPTLLAGLMGHHDTTEKSKSSPKANSTARVLSTSPSPSPSPSTPPPPPTPTLPPILP